MCKQQLLAPDAGFTAGNRRRSVLELDNDEDLHKILMNVRKHLNEERLKDINQLLEEKFAALSQQQSLLLQAGNIKEKIANQQLLLSQLKRTSSNRKDKGNSIKILANNNNNNSDDKDNNNNNDKNHKNIANDANAMTNKLQLELQHILSQIANFQMKKDELAHES